MATYSRSAPLTQDEDGSSLLLNYSMNAKIIISALGILFFMIFIIIIIHLYRRSNLQQRRALSRFRISLSSVQQTCQASGLDKEVVESLPIFAYTPHRGADVAGTKAAECPVCLGEFRPDETCKLLPKCEHFFHVGCIDKWFLSHTTCPLCRGTPGMLLVDEEAGNRPFHYIDASQGQEAQRGVRHIPSGQHNTNDWDEEREPRDDDIHLNMQVSSQAWKRSWDEEREPGDDDIPLNARVSSQARKWRRSFSDKFPCAVREALPSSKSTHMARDYMGRRSSSSHIATSNSRHQESLSAFSRCSSISSFVSPHWVPPQSHVYPPL